uniref:Reverse transcriptase zinc-binding domain-containing protein n=1 Tax=Setaria viridis TaxID=4556 RepID=A0A4U6V9T4_SETVI|nr:hypothetical protein SEVIR_3G054800v2 [Setaria viridis]
MIRKFWWGTLSKCWLPRDAVLRTVAAKVPNPPRRVSELIDHTCMQWKEEIIHNYNRQDDFWAWHYERSGIFSVKSAYRMLIHNRNQRQDWLDSRAENSNIEGARRSWKLFWKVVGSEGKSPMKNKQSAPKWIAPSDGFLKFNVDGVMARSGSKGAVGVSM